MSAMAHARTNGLPCALVLLLGGFGPLRASATAAGGLALTPVPPAAPCPGQLPVHDGTRALVPVAPDLEGRLAQVHARLHQVDARIHKLTAQIDRYSEPWERSTGNARLVIAAFTRRWTTERRAEYRERVALEDEARSLEGALFSPARLEMVAPRWPPSLPPVPEEGARERQVPPEGKAGSRGTEDPWLAAQAEPGTLQRPYPLPPGVGMIRRAPDELSLDPEGGLAYLYRETGKVGRIHPQTTRSFCSDIQFGLSKLFGLCPASLPPFPGPGRPAAHLPPRALEGRGHFLRLAGNVPGRIAKVLETGGGCRASANQGHFAKKVYLLIIFLFILRLHFHPVSLKLPFNFYAHPNPKPFFTVA